MQVVFLKSGLLSTTIHTPTVHYCLNLNQSRFQNCHSPTVCLSPVKVKPRARAVRTYAGVGWKVKDKPTVCTADELHYVPVPNSLWRLALWRYTPPPQAWDSHPAIMAVGVVDGSSEAIFRMLMSLGPSRSEWDFTFYRGSVVEHLDGHTDIIHKQLCSHWLPWGMKPRDMLLRRYWRREDDSTYENYQDRVCRFYCNYSGSQNTDCDGLH